ncbi:TetR family transcriptional regulator [Blastococcus sp. BMG 814]|uniref:TetR family transcriptional regulator n=1 Tax=Blastococcus carthaginiensis TaxID=3050034 RepID=A0ABT9IAE1_9ACTN|nr:TetR family transcriptional regulator [Blastococcus carthaginiensis]MDP5182538.1 TetR family transcriptional regulator [Blastococcus carthaginiensis]
MSRSSNTSAADDSLGGGPSTRERLLRAVIDIAGREGVHMVTHRSVAARADVTHGLVRHYFGTRQAMLAEALHVAVGEDINDVRLVTGDVDTFAEGLASPNEEVWSRRALQFELALNGIRGTVDVALARESYNGYLAEIGKTLAALGIEDPDGSWEAVFFAMLDGLVLQHGVFDSTLRTEAALERVRDLLRFLSTSSRTSATGHPTGT